MMNVSIRQVTAGILLSFLLACSGKEEPVATPSEESWEMVFLPDGPRCRLVIGPDLGATIRNGEERIDLKNFSRGDRSMFIRFEHYDSELSFDAYGVGTWTKTKSGGRREVMPVVLRREEEDPGRADPTPFAGTWRVRFASDDTDAVGTFRALSDRTVAGTFETETGDYRFLHGDVRDATLRLSCFDGAHAFDFRATLQDDGTLAGTFRSGAKWKDTWVATRDAGAALKDGFARSRWESERKLGDLSFVEPSGKEKRTVREVLAGDGPALVYLFGTWCPNCHDAAAYLSELHRRFGPRGLKILGLAFELTDDNVRTSKQVAAYRERHQVSYPILWAGPADKKKATAAFAALDRVRSYPTFLFLDREGRVTDVYSGFAGPATGASHTALRESFEAKMEALIAP